jgi:hypothetical protein
VDGHGYWQHPEIGKDTRIKNDPMVNDPLDSTVTQFARTPVEGRPFTISEVNHPFPHKFAVECYVTLTAYALLHDWDGIVWFDWERGRMEDPKQGLPRNGWFDVSQDPVKLAQLTTAGLMWHRHDVAKARETLVRTYTPEETFEAMRLVQWDIVRSSSRALSSRLHWSTRRGGGWMKRTGRLLRFARLSTPILTRDRPDSPATPASCAGCTLT